MRSYRLTDSARRVAAHGGLACSPDWTGEGAPAPHSPMHLCEPAATVPALVDLAGEALMQHNDSLQTLFRLLPPEAPTQRLAASYFVQMMESLCANYFRCNAADDPGLRPDVAQHLYGRLQLCAATTVPWVQSVYDVRGKRVIEIGCGTGSSTAAFGRLAATIHAIDIDSGSVQCAVDRCRLLGVNNVRFDRVPADWISTLSQGDLGIAPGSIDVVLCHAVLEHLIPEERLALLASIWRVLAIGGVLIVVETQNRLHFYDWHSSFLMFYDVLPDDLAYLYLSRTKRTDTPAKLVTGKLETFDSETRTMLYRWGRGVSFHEFELAIGLDNMRVLADSHSANAIPRGPYFKESRAFELALAKAMEGHSPPVPAGFFTPSLDLVVQKVRARDPK